MTIQEPTVIPMKYKILLIILGLIGIGIILLATSSYGAGLSPDSVKYVAIARNIANGSGIVSYDGHPLISQPPLYPGILAIIDFAFRVDPLKSANFVNAFLFGLIVYLGGLLIFKHISSFRIFALIGTMAIVFSVPLFGVTVFAWSEPLFITFELLSLIFAHSYLAKNDITSLILLSSSVALACLSRYVGVTLILWAALTILIFQRKSIKNKIAHLSIFAIISVLPIGVWLIRNYVISSTFFGSRSSSAFTLAQNLMFVFNELVTWYIPSLIANHRPTLILLGVLLGFFAGRFHRDSWQSVKVILRQINPILLFIIIYSGFLVISATTIAFSQIDDRLLSPIYVPLTLLILILVQAIVDPYRKRFPQKIGNSFPLRFFSIDIVLILGLAIWLLVYPLRITIMNVVNFYKTGSGYSSEAWIESGTIQYLLQNKDLESKCAFYTNGPDAAYILANLSSKMSPSKTRYITAEKAYDISGLKGSWPEENNACLIWFDKVSRNNLFKIDELQKIANINLIANLKDGAIYSIIRK